MGKLPQTREAATSKELALHSHCGPCLHFEVCISRLLLRPGNPAAFGKQTWRSLSHFSVDFRTSGVAPEAPLSLPAGSFGAGRPPVVPSPGSLEGVGVGGYFLLSLSKMPWTLRPNSARRGFHQVALSATHQTLIVRPEIKFWLRGSWRWGEAALWS